MKIIAQLLEFIRSRGITDQQSDYDQMTGFLNVFGFLTALGASGVFFTALIAGQDVIYLAMSVMVFVIYSSLIIFNHFHLTKFVRFAYGAIVPLWIVITILSIGGNFSQGIALATSTVITFLLFRESHVIRNVLVAYNILLYVLPTLYVQNYEPWFGVRDIPGDEIVVFILSLGWISVVFSIYDRKAQTILNLKEKELESRNKELEQFVYLASHDMKAPVRNIMGIIELLKANLEDREYDNLELLTKHLEASAHNLNELIHNVLEVSKYNAIDPETYKPIDLNEELDKALFNLQTDISDRKAKVSKEPLPEFWGNKGDFAILFQNFVENALKYNESPIPTVNISFEPEETHHVIYIRDNGIGIKEQHHSEIFELFKRVHVGEQYSGTGLGLGLCKKIIDKYNGEIQVDSVEGEYTQFCIKLPTGSPGGVGDIFVNPIRSFLKNTEGGLN